MRILPGDLSFFPNTLLRGHRTNSTKLCHLFGREPDMKMVIQNLGVVPKNCLLLGGFTTTSRLKREYIRSETVC